MKPQRCSWCTSLCGGAAGEAAVMQGQHHLQDHRARISEEVRWWSCSVWYSESLCQLVFEGDRRVSHGCRSGIAVDDKADTATGSLVSVENYYFSFLPPTDLSKVRPWAARQPSRRLPWAAVTDGRCRRYGLISPPSYSIAIANAFLFLFIACS